MAEPLKNHFGPEMVHRAADALASVYGPFDGDGFTAMALEGFDDLELTPRCRQIATAMGAHLPQDRAEALDLVVASFGPPLENCDPDDATRRGDENPMTGFFYMPHGYFIASVGGEHFDRAMRANYELTKRFTAEFSIRAQLEANPGRAIAVLAAWANDTNVHVRRLVSEGTRPRLPWAARLRAFQRDPTPVLALLELLKDDPVAYVRRSVANNLNDIAKDHPHLVVDVARRWWADGDQARRRLVKHGLRSLVKAASPDALDVLGYGERSAAEILDVMITPAEVAIGDKVKLQITVSNPSSEPCGALVDLRVHFVKANGSTSPKVFKGAELALDPGASAVVRKTISVAQHSTRTHYRGEHVMEAILNGRTVGVGSFVIS